MELVIRATIIFFFLWFVTRAQGKRAVAEVTTFELIVIVTMGDLVQQGITQEDTSIVGAALSVGTFAVLGLAFSWLSFRWKHGRKLLEGAPVVVVHHGRVLDDVLHAERLTTDELLESARKHGVGDLRLVEVAVLEPDGKLSFLLADGAPETADDPDDDPRG